MATIVTICKNVVLGNQKSGRRDPAIRIKNGASVSNCHTAEVWSGGRVVGRFVYDHDNKKPWGARAWFETVGDTEIRPCLSHAEETRLRVEMERPNLEPHHPYSGAKL